MDALDKEIEKNLLEECKECNYRIMFCESGIAFSRTTKQNYMIKHYKKEITKAYKRMVKALELLNKLYKSCTIKDFDRNWND